MVFSFQENKIGKRKVERNEKEVNPQEVLLDSLAQRKEFFGQKRFETPLRKRIMRLFLLFFVGLFLLLLGRAFWLSFSEGVEYQARAEANYKRFYFERSQRGVIYDRNMEQLVFNRTSFDLGCYKRDLSKDPAEQKKAIERLAGIIGKDPSFIRKKIEKGEERVLLMEGLSHQTVVALKAEISALPGFYLKENPRRKYVSGKIFSHVIGFLGRPTEKEVEEEEVSALDYVGKAGVEKSYRSLLRGRKKKWMVKKDALSKKLSRELVRESQPGRSLVLTIDAPLQRRSFKLLESGLKRAGSESGAVLAMDPDSGEILSLVSLPGFDNNLFFKKMDSNQWKEIFSHPGDPFWNRVVSATYPTGSTIKPLIGVAALEENIIPPGREINCKGKIVVENPWFEDKPWVFHDWTTHGPTDMRKAIAESCNVYFYTVGGGYGDIKGLGVEKVKKYLRLFGWGEKTGLALPGERAGLIPTPEWKEKVFEGKKSIWLPGDTYNLSIGQGYLSATPLQVASSFSALANGGRLMKPRILKRVVNEKKETVRETEPVTKRNDFVKKEALDVARQGMREAVTYGSSVLLSDLPVKAAAKTGTAQTEKKGRYHNWVTVFAPYRDPEIVLTVLIEYVPQEKVAALPVAKKILNFYFEEP